MVVRIKLCPGYSGAQSVVEGLVIYWHAHVANRMRSRRTHSRRNRTRSLLSCHTINNIVSL